MLFSIVIPVYNVEKYLDECLQSILKQTKTINNDCEILLIDDGSTDKSVIICDDYAKKYPDIIKVFHKENQGLLATRRYGFQKSSGEYIINCDSDDFLENKMLELVKQVIVKYESPDVILINYYRYDGKNKINEYKNIFLEKQDGRVLKDSVLCEYLCGHSIVSMCGRVVKRSCIEVDRDYAEYGRLSTGEDTLQSIEIFSKASTFVYLNEALYDYRIGSGMTAKFDENYFFTFKHIFEQIEKEKADWKLKGFDKLFSIKVLQTAGRAITQARYNKWVSIKEEKNFLKSIYDDEMIKKSLKYLKKLKSKLQFDHYVLLVLLKNKMFTFIVLLLKIRNAI